MRFPTMWYVRPYTQSDQSLCLSLEYYMNIKLLNEHNLEFLSLKEDYTGSSQSIHFKMPHCWRSHVILVEAIKMSCISLRYF